MDNIKKIEDFLNRIQGLLDNAKKQGHIIVRVEDLENAFPELKESEDEKFRKYILKCCEETIQANDRGLELSMDTTKKLKNWLEKQGNQKPVISDDALREGITHFGITQYQIDDWLKKYVNVEKQGEQKPAVTDFNAKDWYVSKVDGKIHDMTYNPADKVEPIFNIGDVLCDKSCTTLNKKYQPIIEILDIRNGMYICNNGSFPISQQYEYELVTKKNEPQSAWSDEDESIAESIEGALEGYEGMVSEDWEKEKDWLKSLKNKMQPQIKEWSDEDESYINNAIAACRSLYGEYSETAHWLKCLKDRATWKPSDEQMEIFKELIDDNSQRYFYPTLKSLYNELKKLKEA